MRVLIAFILTFSTAQAAIKFPIPPNDVMAHTGAAYIITDIMLSKGYTKKQAFWTAQGLGLLKEIYDHQYNQSTKEHAKDMTFNALGSGLKLFVYKIELKPKRLWH